MLVIIFSRWNESLYKFQFLATSIKIQTRTNNRSLMTAKKNSKDLFNIFCVVSSSIWIYYIFIKFEIIFVFRVIHKLFFFQVIDIFFFCGMILYYYSNTLFIILLHFQITTVGLPLDDNWSCYGVFDRNIYALDST